ACRNMPLFMRRTIGVKPSNRTRKTPAWQPRDLRFAATGASPQWDDAAAEGSASHSVASNARTPPKAASPTTPLAQTKQRREKIWDPLSTFVTSVCLVMYGNWTVAPRRSGADAVSVASQAERGVQL